MSCNPRTGDTESIWILDPRTRRIRIDPLLRYVPPPLLRNSRLICRLVAIAIDLIRGIARTEPIDRLIDVVVIDFKIDVVVLNFKIKNPN